MKFSNKEDLTINEKSEVLSSFLKTIAKQRATQNPYDRNIRLNVSKHVFSSLKQKLPLTYTHIYEIHRQSTYTDLLKIFSIYLIFGNHFPEFFNTFVTLATVKNVTEPLSRFAKTFFFI